MLAEIARPLPVCADESCFDRGVTADLRGKYDVVNLKLDKTGGLTEAFLTRDLARQMGFKVMVGCMVGSSLSMAPASFWRRGPTGRTLTARFFWPKTASPPVALRCRRGPPA
jgi:L-Ala-D/L-Glu epimerase